MTALRFAGVGSKIPGKINEFDGGPMDPRRYTEYAAGIVEITPALAEYWLTFANPDNGRVLRYHRDKLMRSILAGEFEPTPDHVAFDVNGMLFNGHNRLSVIAKAGKTVNLAVCFGFPASANQKTDKGVSRTGGHTFGMRRIQNANSAHGTCAAIYTYESGLPFENVAVNEHEALAVYDRNPSLMDVIVTESKRVSGGCGIAPAILGCLMYVSMGIDRTESERFFEALKTGAGLELSSPILSLRHRVIAAQKRGELLHRRDYGAFVAKTWNAVRKGKTLSVIKWDSSEGFPMLI